MKLPIKFKRLTPEAKIPTEAKNNSRAVELFAITEKLENSITGSVVEYGTGISATFPPNYIGVIFPLDTLTKDTTLALGNGVIMIDNNFTQEIKLQFRNLSLHGAKKYKVGDKIAQLILIPSPPIEVIEVE